MGELTKPGVKARAPATPAQVKNLRRVVPARRTLFRSIDSSGDATGVLDQDQLSVRGPRGDADTKDT